MQLTPYSLNIMGTVHTLNKPVVMGILNVTPDSFYPGSRIQGVQAVVDKAAAMLSEGAFCLDIGGYSTRPGATTVTEAEELDRVLPAIEALHRHLPQAIISIDTFRAPVARQAVAAGAHIINDVSAGNLDEEMFGTVANLQVPYIIMHMRGTPQTMQQNMHYNNLLPELLDYFAQKLYALTELGVKDVIIDPGFGFSKTPGQQFTLLNNLNVFAMLNCPVLVGFSRKSLIKNLLHISTAQALNGTTVLNTHALQKGASILRVHDVRQAVECITMVNAIQQYA